MAATTIANIQEPRRMARYITERAVTSSELIASSAMINNPTLNALYNTGGKYVDLPNFGRLSGSDEVLNDDGSSLTVNALSTAKQIARHLERAKAFGASDLSAWRSGEDPIGEIGNQFGIYWAQAWQTTGLNVLAGIFADNLANDSGDQIYNIAQTVSGTTTGTYFSKTTFSDFLANTAADQRKDFNVVMCNSLTFNKMVKEELVDYLRASTGDVDVDVPLYLNKYRVIIDDNMPSSTNAVNAGVTDYVMYAFKPGSIYLATAPHPEGFEIQREGLKSESYVITRQDFTIHPAGYAWQESSVAGKSPTNAELATAANWDRVWNKANCGVMKFVYNIE
jgi:hypothetical protein